jgi:hypothetical protein
LDRFLVAWNGAAPTSVAQVAGPTGFKNALQITGAASNTLVGIQQRIESLNCSDLSGANITIQANIATSTSQTVAWYLYYPNAADTFGGALTQVATGTFSTTSTATTFSATIASLPSGATNGLLLAFYPNNAGAFTSGTFTITGVQLEKGSTATSYDVRSYGAELALCQRYALQTVPTAVGYVNYSNGNYYDGLNYSFPVQMRVAPTATLVSNLSATVGSVSVAINAITGSENTTTGATLYGTFASAQTSGRSVCVRGSGGGAVLFNSEL